MIRVACNETGRKMVMLTTAEVMAGFVVLGGLTLSGRFGSTVSEAGFGEMPGWRIYSLIDKAGSWMFWCGIGLFLVAFTIGSAILPALFMRIAAIGYLLALAASLPVVVAFAWRTARNRRAPFYLNKIGSYTLAVIAAIIDFLAADVKAEGIADDSDYDPEDDIESGYISSGYYNYTTGRWDNGCSEGLYLKDDD
jgi:hypothetical protein